MKKYVEENIKLIVLSVCILFTAIFSVFYITQKMDAYIEKNSEYNISLILEQMEKNYDIQLEEYFRDLKQIQNYILENQHSFSLDTYSDYFKSIEKDSDEKLVFIKSNGDILSIDGKMSHLDIQTQSLIDLSNHKEFAQGVTWSQNGKQENAYLVAIPCAQYTIDGQTYSALGALYDYSKIDTMLDMNSYGGKAYVFLLDEKGIVIYTNQPEDIFYRNYSLLKHIHSHGDLSQSQYKQLAKKLIQREKGVKLYPNGSKPYYFGYHPVKSNNRMLITIIPKTTVEYTLVDYQKNVFRLLGFCGLVILILILALIANRFKAGIAAKNAEFEKQKQRLQEESMKALEIEKNKANEANLAKSGFLSNMSHDIRTPMNAIVGLTDLMLHEKDVSTKMQDYIQKIQLASHHLLSLIDDVLDMSKIESKEVTLSQDEIVLGDMVWQVENIIQPQMKEHTHHFKMKVHQIEHEYLIGDGVRIRQIFLNLLTNAVKYTPDGGHIELDLAEKPSSRTGYAHFVCSVSDDGMGMDKEFLPHIYEPFTRVENSVTNKVQGTGLGMAITKQIIDMMDGTIEVESEKGKGSTFTISFELPININIQYDLGIQNALLICEDPILIENMRASFKVSNVDFEVEPSMDDAQKEKYDVIFISDEEQILHIPNTSLIYFVSYVDEKTNISSIDGFIARPFFLSNFWSALIKNQVEDTQDTSKTILQGMRFMCAEDNELNAQILKELLQMYGASCDIYSNGKDIVQAFESVTKNQYNAILMDVQMPVMNGLEAAKAIRNSKNPLGKEIPIIAMTANAFSQDVHACLEAGMDAHIAKPIHMPLLEKTMRIFSGGGYEDKGSS